MLRRLITISLLFIFLYNSIGYYFIFKIQQALIHSKTEFFLNRASITDPSISLIKVSVSNNNSIQWLESDEFIFKGSLYDLQQKKQEGDTIYLYCKNDEQEFELFKELKAFVIEQLDPNNDQAKKIPSAFKLVTQDNICEYSNPFYFTPLSIIEEVHSYRNSFYFSISSKITSPPPKEA